MLTQFRTDKVQPTNRVYCCWRQTSTVCDTVLYNICFCVLKLDLGTVRDRRGSFVKNRGAHLVSPGLKGGHEICVSVYVCLWIEKQNRTAALTRVLKGCVKAAGWGTGDNEGEGGGRNEMSIKWQSKEIMSRWSHILILFCLFLSFFFLTQRQVNTCKNRQSDVKSFVFGSANKEKSNINWSMSWVTMLCCLSQPKA